MIKKIAYPFVQSFPHNEKMILFRKVIYVFLLINAFTLLPIAHELFGYDGIVGATGWNTAKPWYAQGSGVLISMLIHPYNAAYPWIAYVFVYGQILVLIAGLLNFWPRLMAVLLYFLTANLFGKGYLMFTGGEALVTQLLFYMMFIHPHKKDQEISFLQNLLNNTFFIMLIIQIFVVYFFSAVYKWIDPYWYSGEALMYISRVNAFSSGWLEALLGDKYILSAIGTYTVLLYQTLFPILVWSKKLKVPFLLLGCFIHLGIAIGMGIFAFGILMILCYLLFLNENQIKSIQRFLTFKRAKGNDRVSTEIP